MTAFSGYLHMHWCCIHSPTCWAGPFATSSCTLNPTTASRASEVSVLQNGAQAQHAYPMCTMRSPYTSVE